MAQYYTPVQDGIGNPLAHFGQEVFNPVMSQLETLAYYQSGWYGLVPWTTLVTPVNTLTLSGIDTAWRHLKLMALLCSSQGATQVDLSMDFNSGLGFDYYWHKTRHGSSTNFNAGVGQGSIDCGRIVASLAPSGYFSLLMVDLHHYQRTDVKTAVSRLYTQYSDNAIDMEVTVGGAEWRGSGAINAINLISGGGNLIAGSRYVLYGQDRG